MSEEKSRSERQKIIKVKNKISNDNDELHKEIQKQKKVEKILENIAFFTVGTGSTVTVSLIKKDQSGDATVVGILSVSLFFVLTRKTIKNLLYHVLSEIQARQFEDKYYKSLINTYCKYQTLGLDAAQVLPDLNKVFVLLQVVAKSTKQMSSAIIQNVDSSTNSNIWDWLAKTKTEPLYRRIAIIGAPGAGKTTLLQYLTLTYAQNTERQKHPQAPKLIPILLYLREIRKLITKTKKTPKLPYLITHQLKNQESSLGLNSRWQWFEEQLVRGRCLVMLDGLDEVAYEEEEYKAVINWIENQMQVYAQSIFLLTSRPFAYINNPFKEVGICLEIQPFSFQQVQQFLHNWYLQNEILQHAGKEDSAVRSESLKIANYLIEQINNSPTLQAMALNPLLLTMIATVNLICGALPASRISRIYLYQEICNVLLERRQKAKGMPQLLTASEKLSVLQLMALELMQLHKNEFILSADKDLVDKIQTQLSKVSNKLNLEEFLKQIEKVSGLLLETELGVYQFIHQSFQEYLAAKCVKETNQENTLIEHINDPWWYETMRFYAAESDVTNLIRSALQNPTSESLKLAYDCLEEGKSVEPWARQHLEKLKNNNDKLINLEIPASNTEITYSDLREQINDIIKKLQDYTFLQISQLPQKINELKITIENDKDLLLEKKVESLKQLIVLANLAETRLNDLKSGEEINVDFKLTVKTSIKLLMRVIASPDRKNKIVEKYIMLLAEIAEIYGLKIEEKDSKDSISNSNAIKALSLDLEESINLAVEAGIYEVSKSYTELLKRGDYSEAAKKASYAYDICQEITNKLDEEKLNKDIYKDIIMKLFALSSYWEVIKKLYE